MPLYLIAGIKVVLLVGLCSALQSASSERSIEDSSHSLTAQQVMRTAMKLPPHILPTLDELDPNVANQVGVYVPGISDPVGIYVPKKAAKTSTRKPQKEQQPIKQLTPPERFKRKIPKKRPPEKNSIFSVHLRPGSPLGKLYDLSKLRSQELVKNLSKIKLKKIAPARQRPPPPLPRKRRRRKHAKPESHHPYQFEEANFQLPSPSEDILRRKDDFGHFEAYNGDDDRPQSHVHKFVPFFVKEALAKSFLKRPERYLQRLYAQQQRQKHHSTLLSSNRNNDEHQGFHKQNKRARFRPRKKQQQQQMVGINNQFQPLESQKKDDDLPTTFKAQAELSFDSSFPWGEQANTLTKYENTFKSGSLLGWSDKKDDVKKPVTKTLCFCCDESEDFLKGDLIKRKKKSLKIEDAEQSEQIMLNKEYINDQIQCIDQEPIEVILTFNEKAEKVQQPRVIPPQLQESFLAQYYNFDPVKLQHIKSAETSFSQRRSYIESESTTTTTSTTTSSTTTEEPRKRSESTTMKMSSLLKEASVPNTVDTLPGYNILRLFTGG